MRGKDAVSSRINMHLIQIDADFVSGFSRFLIGYLQQSIKFHWLKFDRFLQKLEYSYFIFILFISLAKRQGSLNRACAPNQRPQRNNKY